MNVRAALFLGSCILLAPVGAGAVAQPTTQPVSPAETLLFETDHLARVAAPAVLVYDFRKVSNVEPGFSDKVQLDVSRDKGATLHFLSGAHEHAVPPLADAHGNPVLLGFLERDIAEMSRATGGSASYFRKRIRMALAEGGKVASQSVTWQNKPLPARVVRIQPYLDDPMHAHFERYVRKTYTFVLSEQVPGGIVELRSSLGSGAASGAAKAPPEIDETLTLAGITHPGR
jgi:hypothetical protein